MVKLAVAKGLVRLKKWLKKKKERKAAANAD
jgi:hypothetical protein